MTASHFAVSVKFTLTDILTIGVMNVKFSGHTVFGINSTSNYAGWKLLLLLFPHKGAQNFNLMSKTLTKLILNDHRRNTEEE